MDVIDYNEYPGLDKFLNNMNQKLDVGSNSANLATTYVLQTFDRDGNMTDEKYALNLLTDYGLMYRASDKNYYYIIIGDGASAENVAKYTRYSQYHWRAQTSATTNNSLSQRGFDNDMWWVRVLACSGTFDYEISGVTSDINVNELCLSDGSRVLAHATVYDADGEFSSIVKHRYEKLTIRVFMVSAIHEDVLLNTYQNGLHVLFDPLTLFTENLSSRLIPSGIYFINERSVNLPTSSNAIESCWYGTGTSQTSYYSSESGFISTYGPNDQLYSSRDTTIYGSHIIEDTRRNFSYMISDYNNQISIGRDCLMDTPESIAPNTPIFTNSITDGAIDKSLGTGINTDTMNRCIPINDFNMTDSKMFNYLTKEWDIQDTFTNAPDAYYRNPMSYPTNYLSIYMQDLNNVWKTMYVFINPRDDIPITSLNFYNIASTGKMYLCSKYWDRSTWDEINVTRNQKIINLTGSQQYFRYLVSEVPLDTSAPVITPVRSQPVHSIGLSKPSYAITGSIPAYTNDRAPYFKPLSSDAEKWVLSRDHLLFIDNGVCEYAYHLYGVDSFTLTTSEPADWSTNYKDYYTRSGTDPMYQYEHVTGVSAPTWAADTYYSATLREIDPATIRYSFNNGKTIVVAPYGGRIPHYIRVYTINAYGEEPTSVDYHVHPNVTDETVTNPLCGSYSKSDNGYIGFYNNRRRGYVLDINNGIPMYFENVVLLHIQDFTNYMVYIVPDVSPYTYVVYDLSTQTIKQTIQMDDAYSISAYTNIGWCGCGNYVYMRLWNNSLSTNQYFVYQISTNNLVEIISTMALPISRCYATPGVNDKYRIDYNGCVELYHPDGMLIGWMGDSSNNSGYLNGMIRYINFQYPYKSQQVFLYGDYDLSNSSYYERTHFNMLFEHNNQIPPFANLIETPDGKHLILTDSANPYIANYQIYNPYVYGDNSSYRHTVTDIGLAFSNLISHGGNAGWNTGAIMPQVRYRFPAVTPINNSVGGITYFDNGIIVIDGAGSITWYPLETILPHKITGTTRTYQFIHNPKKISANYDIGFGIAITNRSDIVSKPQTPIEWNSNLRWTTQYGSGITISAIDTSTNSVKTHDLLYVTPGTVITLNAEISSDVISWLPNIASALKLEILLYRDDTAYFPNHAYIDSSYQSIAIQNNTVSYTIPTSITAAHVYAGVQVYCTLSNVGLTPAMFSTLELTVTPPA